MQFIYSGQFLYLNNNLTLIELINNDDKERKAMSIIVYDNYAQSKIIDKKNIIKSNQVICPKCQESARIKFENLQIKIYDCKNGHISYLLLNEFEDSQIIDESKVFCNVCREKNKSNTYNRIMYICNSCKIFLCPLCHQNHDKSHNIINYEQKYYICEIHNRTFNSFCKNCKRDICVLCESEHEQHELVSYSKIIPKTDLLNNSKNLIKKVVNEFNEKISSMINALNNIKMNLEIYPKIIENIIDKYRNNNINYNILKNLCDISKLEEQNIYKDLNKIIEDSNGYLSKLKSIQEKLTTKHQIENNINNNDFNQNIQFNQGNNNNFIMNYNNNNIQNMQNFQFNNNMNTINNISNNQEQNNQIPFPDTQSHNLKPPRPYFFSMKGLKNIGSTYYMNATLQCLLHVSELTIYFIDEYPKDQKFLLDTNRHVPSGGNISREFFNLVIGVNDSLDYVKGKSNNLNPKTNKKSSNSYSFFSFLGFGDSYDDSSYDRAFAPKDFKRTLGIYNPQFQKFEANDSKDLILYLLQTMHDELNYYGNRNQRLNYVPNQYNIYETYNHFIANYNMNNFSKISLLFYGTYKNTTTCTICKKELYNFQKFEFISFGMYYYNRKKFNILDGFRDNSSPTMLKGDNKFLCNSCNKLQEAQTTCKIFEPPQKLLINIDYGKNKKYQPTAIEFSEEIDITEFVDFNFQQKIIYKIIGVCTHYGHSGSYGHYVAFCRNRENDKWYEFNDSFCSECNKREIYRGSPYLLLYERVFN